MKAALREYRAGDLEAIFRLDEACFEREFRFDRETMRRFAVAHDAVTLIAEDEDKGIVGFVIVHVEPMAAGKRGYVVTLDVAPEQRRAGLAGRLMEEAERRSAEAGAARMELHVFAENEGGDTVL